MPIAIRYTEFDDFEALRDVVQDSHSDVVQLGRGRMTGAITHMAFDDDFGISTGKFSLAMRASGVLSNTRWCLGFLLGSDGDAFGHHHQFKAGDLAIAAPGEERYIKFQNNTEYVAPVIAPDEVERHLASQPGALELLHRHKLSILHATPATAAANVANMKPLLTTLIHDGKTMPDETLQFYRRGILDLITAPIRDAVHYRGARLVAQDTMIRDIEHFYATRDTPIHISEICEQFGVHRRALHRAFHEVVGMGPVAFLRRKRLNDVHTALRRDGHATTVRQIAINHGFIDPSRFAQAYKSLFGELPSQTLKRNIVRLVPFVLWGSVLCASAQDISGLDHICPMLAAAGFAHHH